MNYLLEDKVICTRDIATDWQHHVRLSSVGQRNSPEFLLPEGARCFFFSIDISARSTAVVYLKRPAIASNSTTV